jgi:NAD(P)-dependent dehydrogenase (short-subunit alcohol dehydrogenase family)
LAYLTSLPDHQKSKGTVTFQHLDLGDIQGTIGSTHELRHKLIHDKRNRIDMLVCNTGIFGPPLRTLSKDEYDKAFAVILRESVPYFLSQSDRPTKSCTAIDLVEIAADETQDARIIFVSSEGYKMAAKVAIASYNPTLLAMMTGFWT